MSNASVPSPLTGIVYYSKASRPFDDEALQALAGQASQDNVELNVTGLLLYVEGYFMQYIEGESKATHALMEKVRQDERHTVLKELTTETLAARLFPAWNMRWLRDSELRETRLHEQLARRFAQGEGNDDAAQAQEIWRLVDGLADVCAKLT